MNMTALKWTIGAVVGMWIFSLGWLRGFDHMSDQYNALAVKLEVQQRLAEQTLERVTKERDRAQARLDQLAQTQEAEDEKRLLEIERLNTELRDRPYRVRVVTDTRCDRGSPGGSAEDPDRGSGGEAAADGLLPEENSRRLTAALTEVETLSAAYSSCRATLFNYRDTRAQGGN